MSISGSMLHHRLIVLASHLRGGVSNDHNGTFMQASPLSSRPCTNTTGSLTVCFCTHEGGPHVQSYLDGMRDTVEVEQVALSDPTGHWIQAARDTLGDKLTSVHTDPGEMITNLRPDCTIVAYEAALAPPVVRAALEAGCHVLAEKPACVSIEAIDELVALAAKQQRMLMLAFANRVRPEVQKARELVTTGALGKVYALEMHTIADQKRLTAPEYWERWCELSNHRTSCDCQSIDLLEQTLSHARRPYSHIHVFAGRRARIGRVVVT